MVNPGSVSTSRQVVNSLMRKHKAERVALHERPWSDTLPAWVAQGYPLRRAYKEVGERCWHRDGRSEPAKVAGAYEEPVPLWEHFGFDMVEVGPRFDALPIRGQNEIVAETEEWVIRRNGAGAALKFWKHKAGTPEHIDFRMTTRKIWERDYRSYLLELDPERVDTAAMRKQYDAAHKAGKWAYYGQMFVWERMRQSMGDVVMYESLLTEPDWVHDFCRVYTDFFEVHFRYVFEQVGLPDGIWIAEDLGYKNGLFASPRVLRELVLPYHKEIVDFCHSYGLPVILHTDGSIAEALPLIVEAGYDALNPIERKAVHNEPLVFADKYGDRLAFVGGFDTRILETNDRDTIRREVAHYLESMKAHNARLVFGSDHSVSPNTRYESYRYAVEVYREHMMY